MNETVGYVLLGVALVPLGIAWQLSAMAIRRASEVVAQTQQASEDAKEAVANAETVLDESGRALMAQPAAVEVKEKVGAIPGQVDALKDALKGMTGVYAPAAVSFGISVLLFSAALAALGVVEFSTGAS
jgi:stage V sporulation protein SpoVS